MKLVPTLLCDFYKLSHRQQYPEGTEVVYSTWTPRSGKHLPEVEEVVSFGFQGFVKEFMIEFFNENFFSRPKEEIVNEYSRVVKNCLFVECPETDHIEELHDLGYLPLEIKSIDEGTLVPFRVPMLTIENTDPRFFWLTNYLETVMSANLWQPSTTASIARVYRNMLNEYAVETTGSTEGVEFQGHDFSMRGMCGVEAAARAGAGHLLSFAGTDTIPAISYLEQYYNADITKELVGCSVPATEHSVMCAGSKEEEAETYRRLIEDLYPAGIVSIVSDTWDLWEVLTDIIPSLKDKILARKGAPINKTVIRPDSGNPVDILCGETFPQFDTLEHAQNRVEGLTWAEAKEDCEGSYNCGNDFYSKKVQVGDKYYEITFEFEYNRHDKTYYYVENQKLNSISEFTLSPAQKGVVELLYETFGGETTPQGYKLLNPAIGAIYGDAITIDRCRQICERLKAKGFASTNVVYGIGSFTYQHMTRDSLGFAMKATSVTVNGQERAIFKDPVTDDGTKKSAKGRVEVINGLDDKGNKVLTYVDETNRNKTFGSHKNRLTTLFKNGKLVKETSLAEIRSKLLE